MATEYKLSYTAEQIDERLGRVDNLVASVNGITPDGNGNVEIINNSENVIQYVEQELTDEQKAQARANIGAASDENSPIIVTVTNDTDDGKFVSTHYNEELLTIYGQKKDVIVTVSDCKGLFQDDHMYNRRFMVKDLGNSEFIYTAVNDDNTIWQYTLSIPPRAALNEFDITLTRNVIDLNAEDSTKSPLVVTLSYAEDGTLIASHNYEEISAACTAGREVVLYVDYLHFDELANTNFHDIHGSYFMLTMRMDIARFTSTEVGDDCAITYHVVIDHRNQVYLYYNILDLNNYTTKEYVEENFQKKKLVIQFEQTGYDFYTAYISGQKLKDALKNGLDIAVEYNYKFYELAGYKTDIFNATNKKEIVGATFKRFDPDTFDVVTIEIEDYIEYSSLNGTVTTNTTTIPTKTSELENDNGFITASDIPESNFSTELSRSLSGFFTKFETLLHQLAYVQTDHIGESLASDAKALVKILNNVPLTNLTAVYSGGYVTIGTNLDNLRKYITVTGTYADGTEATITDYELSGTIIDGESVLTITSGDISATVPVTGTPNTYLYSNGFEYEDITGGWINEGNIAYIDQTTISKDNGTLSISAANTGDVKNNAVNTYATKNTIDLTKYSKFVIDGEFTVSGANGSSNVRATSTLNTSYDFTIAYEKSVVVFNAQKSTTTNGVFEVDLTTLDFSALDPSKVYLAISAGIWAANTNASCDVRNIYLVPKAV